MSTRRWLSLGALGLAALVIVGLLIWRDDILETLLDPKIPYAVYTPPPAPDYARPSSWALRPPAGEAAAGIPVFFVAPTTFNGGRDWNGPVRDPDALGVLRRIMLPNYAEPFAQAGPVWAPLYRQASLYTSLSLFDDALEARAFAYRDIEAAFAEFQREIGDRAFILAGVEQGGSLAARLLSQAIAPDPVLRPRLVAAYLIDTVVPADAFSADAAVPACTDVDQTGCVLAWQTVSGRDLISAERILRRARVWDAAGRLVSLDARSPLCVNPLLHTTSESFAPARLNLGAANASGLEWGLRPGFMARQVSARCVGGFLRVSQPRSHSLRRHGGFVERLRAPSYNLFWADIEADATRRARAFLAGQRREQESARLVGPRLGPPVEQRP